MPSISAVFLILSLVLAVVVGPQTRSWSWGPAMLALAISVIAAVPPLWQKKDRIENLPLLILGFVTACWFAWRAAVSPVAEFGNADLMLLAGATGAFVSLRAIRDDAVAGRIVIWGITLLLAASLVVIGKQVADPSFLPLFHTKSNPFPSGFYLHYNEAANYLIASSMIVAAAALFGNFTRFSRILMVVISIAGLVGVYFTHSRGGILGAAIAAMVLACTALVFAKRDGSRWFAPGLVALPLLAIAAGGFLLSGWQSSQEIRQAGSGIRDLMDNDIRLYLLGLAVSTAGLHPLWGGGSRSFSWESIRLWDAKDLGEAGALPQFVHNEFMQSATDYGIIGALLVAFLLVGIILTSIIRMAFGKLPGGSSQTRVWLIGGCAAFAGMMVQSSFSFVFHLFPGVLLLGICLSFAAPSYPGIPDTFRRMASAGLLTLAAILCLLILVPLGIRETRLTRILWPIFVTNTASGETAIERIGEALEIHPSAELLVDRGSRLQLAFGTTGGDSPALAEQAIRDYAAASRLNPFDPQLTVNQANLLSQLKRDAEAEALYAQSIALQGGFEPGFRSHYSLANHLFRKSHRLFDPQDPTPALATLETARDEYEKAVASTPSWMMGVQGREIRIALHEKLGTIREASGDLTGALEAYEFATTIPTGQSANFHVAQLMAKIGKDTWDARKPAEALWYFTEAQRRVSSTSSLPRGVPPSQRLNLITYLDQCISFLKGAHVQAVKPED